MERKRYCPATSAQTTLAEGALSAASVGMGMLPPLAPGVGVGPLTCCVPGVAILTQCAPPSTVRCNEPRPSAYPICASAKTKCAPAGVSVLKSESYWWNCWPPFVDSYDCPGIASCSHRISLTMTMEREATFCFHIHVTPPSVETRMYWRSGMSG